MTTWRVVGGGDASGGLGGILVRDGVSLKSAALPERLSTGAIVEELELQGDRLRFKLLSGTGPTEGWVSTKLKGKELVVKEGGAESNGADAEISDADFLKSLGLSAEGLDELPTSTAVKSATSHSVGEKATTTPGRVLTSAMEVEKSPASTATKEASSKEASLNPVDSYVSDIKKLRSGYREVAKLVKLLREELRQQAAADEKAGRSRLGARSQWRCVFKPRIAIRMAMDSNAKIARSVAFGEVVEAIGEPLGTWLKLSDGNFAMVSHEKLGQLLEPADAAEKAEQDARIQELVDKIRGQLRACSIPGAAGINITRDEDKAGASIIKAMHASEVALEEAVGKRVASKTIAEHAVKPELQKDGTEMFTLDFLSIGRGQCLRCRTCACLKWTYDLKDLRNSRCLECDCEARDHKFLNEGIGEQPGYYPGITDEDMEQLEDLRQEFEKRASWH